MQYRLLIFISSLCAIAFSPRCPPVSMRAPSIDVDRTSCNVLAGFPAVREALKSHQLSSDLLKIFAIVSAGCKVNKYSINDDSSVNVLTTIMVGPMYQTARRYALVLQDAPEVACRS